MRRYRFSEKSGQRHNLIGRRVTVACLWGLLASVPAMVQARTAALLVGVGQYESGIIPKLDGPVNDVAAMRDALQKHLDVASGDLIQLVDKQATYAGILAGLQTLQDKVKRGELKQGDRVVVYFSGHGTAPENKKIILPLPDGTGAFFPSDADLTINKMIVGRIHLRPLFKALDQAGVQVMLVADSCYSGSMFRSGGKAQNQSARFVPSATQLVDDDSDLESLGDVKKVDAYPYTNGNVVMISAASVSETAQDLDQKNLSANPSWTTVDGKYHGALTDAVLRVINGSVPADANGDGKLSPVEIHRAVSGFMQTRAYGHTPQLRPNLSEEPQASAVNRPWWRSPSKEAVASSGAVKLKLDVREDKIVARLRNLPGVQVVTEGEDLLLGQRQGTLVLQAASGDPISEAGVDSDRQINELQDRIQAHGWWRNLAASARGAQALRAELSPSAGAYVGGEQLAACVKPERISRLLMLDLFPNGQVMLLYPVKNDEIQAWHRPDVTASVADINVQAPYGLDSVLVLAFEYDWPGVKALPQTLSSFRADGWAPLLAELKRNGGKISAVSFPVATYAPSSDRLALRSKPCR